MFNITLPRFKIFFQYTVCTLYSINVQLIKEFDRYFFFLSSVSSVTVGWKVENVPMRFSLIFRNWTKICWTFRPNHPAQVSLSTRLTLVDGFRTCWAHNMNYRFFNADCKRPFLGITDQKISILVCTLENKRPQFSFCECILYILASQGDEGLGEGGEETHPKLILS